MLFGWDGLVYEVGLSSPKINVRIQTIISSVRVVIGVNRRKWKISCIIGFLSLAAVVFSRYPVFRHESPYVMYRLAVMEYQLYAPLSMDRLGDGFWLVNVPSQIGNVFFRWTSFPLSGSLIAEISLVTGLSVLSVAQLPLVPVGAFIMATGIANHLVDDDVVPAVFGAFFMFQFAAKNFHFQQYQWGQFVVLPFVILVLLLIYRRQRRDMYRWAALLAIAIVALKLSSPKDEPILAGALVTLALVRALLARWSVRREIGAPIAPFAILASVVLFGYNPKFFNGVLTRIGEDSPAINLISDSGGLLIVANLLKSVLSVLPGFGSPTQPVPFEATGGGAPAIVSYLGIGIYGLCGLVATVFIARALYRREWDTLTTGPILVIVAVGVGGAMNFLFRGALLGRPDTTAIYLTMVVAGLFAFSRLLSRRHLQVVAVGLLALSVVSFGAIATSQGHAAPYNRAGTDAVADWTANTTYGPTTIMTDFHSWAQLQYEYGEIPVRNFSGRFPLAPYTPQRYPRAINGTLGNGNRTDIDLYVVNERTLEYPVHSRTWTFLEPLEKHDDAIRSNEGLDKVYASEGYSVYLPESA